MAIQKFPYYTNIHIIGAEEPSRFGSVVAHPDMDGKVSGSSPGHTKRL